ncbi:F-box domain-containing protein [Mycena indigotica]|uniref:F-box domain-containing protein n=1 Tax=Mycena indigotica TaxID=2126181 RepID=A0A8H6VSQ4_9AGAR|nr:F-box domain-containing protein [Mycena indigotica]KAF7290566.1 F-box domain-containing protein [Mycena indigotica]
MSKLPSQPNEILHIILSQLGHSSLTQVSLAHRVLHAIALPLLFSRFTFYTYVLNDNEVQFELDRLEFWASRAISQHVRSCEVRPSVWTAPKPMLLESTLIDAISVVLISWA